MCKCDCVTFVCVTVHCLCLLLHCNRQLLVVVQVYKSHLADDATVHDAGVDFHSGNDCEGHCLRERASSEGGDEGDGAWQCCTLGIMVYHQLSHDASLCVSACHRTQGN